MGNRILSMLDSIWAPVVLLGMLGAGVMVFSIVRPDVAGVLSGRGGINVIEVLSPSQRIPMLKTKITTMDQLLGELAGPGSRVVRVRPR